jgi:heme-degrading monooxygenase HmoA
MTQPCFEIVTYTVGNSEGADLARAKARKLIEAFAGFISWTAFSGTDDPTRRADLVVWQSAGDAEKAAQAVGTDPAFADFRASITRVISLGHYSTDDGKFMSQL